MAIANIDRVYPSGFDQYKKDNEYEFENILYNDDYLFRDGAMNHIDIKSIVKDCEELALVGYKDGKWVDLTVIAEISGTGRECDLLDYDYYND